MSILIHDLRLIVSSGDQIKTPKCSYSVQDSVAIGYPYSVPRWSTKFITGCLITDMQNQTLEKMFHPHGSLEQLLIAILPSVWKRSKKHSDHFSKRDTLKMVWKQSEKGLKMCVATGFVIERRWNTFFAWSGKFSDRLFLDHLQTLSDRFRPFSDRAQKCNQHLPLCCHYSSPLTKNEACLHLITYLANLQDCCDQGLGTRSEGHPGEVGRTWLQARYRGKNHPGCQSSDWNVHRPERREDSGIWLQSPGIWQVSHHSDHHQTTTLNQRSDLVHVYLTLSLDVHGMV